MYLLGFWVFVGSELSIWFLYLKITHFIRYHKCYGFKELGLDCLQIIHFYFYFLESEPFNNVRSAWILVHPREEAANHCEVLHNFLYKILNLFILLNICRPNSIHRKNFLDFLECVISWVFIVEFHGFPLRKMIEEWVILYGTVFCLKKNWGGSSLIPHIAWWEMWNVRTASFLSSPVLVRIQLEASLPWIASQGLKICLVVTWTAV